METFVIVAWSITLILALVLTGLLLPVIIRVVFALREIDRLAQRTLHAAVGVAENTASIAALDDVLSQAVRLLNAIQVIGGVSAGIHQKVAAVGGVLVGKKA
jgi:hypothetical protein